jgi:Ser/Thr protein kinase RdoA (MazF antagonist)
MTVKEKFFQRIEYSGKLDSISSIIVKEFGLGDFLANKLVTVGYEDFNYILEVARSKYFVKIFSTQRTDNDCRRCVEVLLKAIDAGIAVPKLMRSPQGYFHKTKIGNTKIRLCVMEYIEGKDFFSIKQYPNVAEIKFLAYQSALISQIKVRPKFVYDEWAVPNFLKEFKKKSQYLTQRDFEILKPLVEEFMAMEIVRLPHCFIHGDILTTNVIKDKEGKIWIIDFSVANYYPRIQEIAVLACDLIFDEKNKTNNEHNLALVLEEYQKKIKLTKKEILALPVYIKLAHAMHVLLANYEKKIKKNDSKENAYFLRRGRMGLR